MRICVQRLCLVAFLAVFAARIAGGAERDTPPPGMEEPDHTLWLVVESSPPGAVVLADGAGSVRLAETPCTLPVDLYWPTRWGRKRWDRLTVVSPRQIARAVPTGSDRYELQASFRLQKRGYETVRWTGAIAEISGPRLDEEAKKHWPTRRALNFALTPVRTSSESYGQDASLARTRHVVLGGPRLFRTSGESGMIVIPWSAADVEISVAGRRIGAPPVVVHLPPGEHRVTILRGGEPAREQTIRVAPNSSVELASPF